MNHVLEIASDADLKGVGVEVVHHFAGGVYAKEVSIPAGRLLEQHKHPYAHVSVLGRGRVAVTSGGGHAVEYEAPTCITIPAGVEHSVMAITDATWFCIHATDETDSSAVDASILGRSVIDDAMASSKASKPIELIDRGLPVDGIRWALMEHPELWNEHRERTENTSSPHHGLDDIWVRYGDAGRVRDDAPHSAFWYPCADVLPGIKNLCLDIMRAVGGTSLGGVLITRIPPGATCKPHADLGWHAKAHAKFGVQIASAPGQKFCFEGAELETMPGDLFAFDNQREHWVTNPTAHERITMIVCVRLEN